MGSTENRGEPIKIVVSMGDPLGIGPELCLKMAADSAWTARMGAAMTIVGSLDVLDRMAHLYGIEIDFMRVDRPAAERGSPAVIDPDVFDGVKNGVAGPTVDGGRASMGYIERALSEIMAQRADALVTCPISKEALSAAGCKHPGHTEMLGELTGSTARPVMMMLSDELRVAFVTTHVAIRDLSDALTVEKVVHTAVIFVDALNRYFGVDAEKIALCAFNPHAGDGGRFGDEEQRVLEPALNRLWDLGMDIKGPVPADSLFYKAARGDYNGVVALYHDQGMIPVKMQGPEGVVNITIGLPLIRTSPAHGTAYDIAGRGVADPTSLKQAIDVAVGMAELDRA